MKTGTAQRVREVIMGFRGRVFAPADVTRSLGLTAGQKIHHVLDDMMARGELEHVDYGRYRLLAFHPADPKPSPIRTRVCRAVYVRRAFCAREIAMLADADQNYVGKILRRLVADGEVELVGRRLGRKGLDENLYRLRHPDRFYARYVCAGQGDG